MLNVRNGLACEGSAKSTHVKAEGGRPLPLPRFCLVVLFCASSARRMEAPRGGTGGGAGEIVLTSRGICVKGHDGQDHLEEVTEDMIAAFSDSSDDENAEVAAAAAGATIRRRKPRSAFRMSMERRIRRFRRSVDDFFTPSLSPQEVEALQQRFQNNSP